MMGNWKDMNDRERKAAERVFDALSTMDWLTGPDGRAKSETVSFTELWAFVHDGAGARDREVRVALMRNPRLRRDFDRLMADTAVCHFPRAAAASDGAVDERECDGFSLRIRVSKAVETQCYVIIRIDPGFEATPTSLFATRTDGEIVKQTLPEIQDGTIQILADVDSDLVCALREPGTEVHLR